MHLKKWSLDSSAKQKYISSHIAFCVIQIIFY
jgi:hypothetical protein